jgi:hypothetical protein
MKKLVGDWVLLAVMILTYRDVWNKIEKKSPGEPIAYYLSLV